MYSLQQHYMAVLTFYTPREVATKCTLLARQKDKQVEIEKLINTHKSRCVGFPPTAAGWRKGKKRRR